MFQVLAFVQDGCPACEAAKPVVQRLAEVYARCVDTRFVDVNREGLLADAMQVRETPTIMGNVNYHPTIRLIGATDIEQRLNALYLQLLADGSCQWKGDI